MTVHIAASLPNSSTAVILCDSQGSTSNSESHGAQKLYAGEDYLIGCAGHSGIINRLFEALGDEPHLDATGIVAFVEVFLTDQVKPDARGSVDIVLLTASGGHEPAIQEFSPDTFTHFGKRSMFTSLGSGAEFVYRAMRRDRKNGISYDFASLPDLFVMINNLAEAANESLTVDDVHLIGFLRGGRTYLLGHRDINPYFIAPAIAAPAAWNNISHEFEEVRAILETIKSEISTGQHSASNFRKGALSPVHVAALEAANAAIVAGRAALEARIVAYCNWYDALLGR